MSDARVVAATDVGSNTVHMLVGEVRGDAVREVHREVLMPRLGAAVAATGGIGAAKIRDVAESLARFGAAAEAHGASLRLLCATEAVRRAADRDEALREFGAAYGAPCVLLPGEVEARLSFRGAASVVSGRGLLLVCDIGGGSTEFALGEAHSGAQTVVSLPIGSGAATDRWLHSDPPTDAELRACRDGVLSVLRGAPGGRPEHIVVTGGTASTLPVLLDRDRETHLDAEDLARCRALLARHPSAEIAERFHLDPARARVLAGGVEIVDAVRLLFDAERIRVTIHGLRTGMILAWSARGDRWVEG
jgi:exopolyphosphatase/guanosine-5'-triphosphate,3'-diphosphate pyrophosphatase